MIIAGIDEAGYGPLLGPLVVSATAFELPPSDSALPTTVEALPCLWKSLRAAVAKKSPATKGRLLIADSKVIHNLTDGDKLLERGVLSMARAMSNTISNNNNVSGTLAPEMETATGTARLLEFFGCSSHGLGDHPWYQHHDLPLPWMCDPGDVAIAANMLKGAMSGAGIRLVAMRTALIPERAFNRLVGGTNNKASALVSITLTHLYHLHQNFGAQGLVVGIDKQGGREHYTQLLLQYFPEAQLRVLLETPKASVYLLQEPSSNGSPGRQTVIHFREKGETHFLPTALASMICKYLRETCMHTFNSWWCKQIEGLKPTAGYYQDGMRWLTVVEPHLARLNINRDHLVRCR